MRKTEIGCSSGAQAVEFLYEPAAAEEAKVSASEGIILQRFLAGLRRFAPRIRKVILFGSRARGDDRPWSDYDLLILVDRRDRSLVDGIYDAAVGIQADEGCDLSLKIISTAEWERRQALRSLFVENVLREGVTLG